MKKFNQIPKIDLHCHLDGSIQLDTMQKLLEKRGRIYTREELQAELFAPEDCPSLAEYLKRFELPIQCLQTKEELKEAAQSLAISAAKENVTYLEVRFAPRFSTAEGLKIPEILESVHQGLEIAREKTGIYSGIIVCSMRHDSQENNLQMLKEAREMYGAGVVAWDLAGDEKAFPTSNFRELYREARKLEFPFTIHSGECGSKENIREAIELGAKRLGHGIAMRGDRELMKICREKQIGVELCPTSNLQTKAIASWSEYPYEEFVKYGVPLSVNTDNRTVSNTDSTRELEVLENHFSMDEEALRQIYLWSVDMAFATDDVKDALCRKWSR